MFLLLVISKIIPCRISQGMAFNHCILPRITRVVKARLNYEMEFGLFYGKP